MCFIYNALGSDNQKVFQTVLFCSEFLVRFFGRLHGQIISSVLVFQNIFLFFPTCQVRVSRLPKAASWILAVCEGSEYKGVWGAELAHGCHFAAIPCRVAWQMVFFFPCYVPGGNSVTFGLESPLVRL